MLIVSETKNFHTSKRIVAQFAGNLSLLGRENSVPPDQIKL